MTTTSTTVRIGVVVEEVESMLATGKFGNSTSLRTNSDTFYDGVSRLFTDVFDGFSLPPATTPTQRVLIRGYLDEILIYLARDENLARAKGAELMALLAAGDEPHPAGPSSADRPMAVGPADSAGGHRPPTMTGWERSPLADMIDDRFHTTMRNDGHAIRISLLDPTAQVEAGIDAATDLLHRLLPKVAPPTTAGIAGIAVFTGNLSSGFISGTPLMVYLNQDVLANPLGGADALFHECLHQKLVEVQRTRDMLRHGYDDSTSHTVLVPWDGPDRWFSVDRSLAAFHVYVHLALLHLAALDRRGGYVGVDDELRTQTGLRWARARFFADALGTSEAGAELGVEGRELVRWLTAATDRLGDAELATGRRLGDEVGRYGD